MGLTGALQPRGSIGALALALALGVGVPSLAVQPALAQPASAQPAPKPDYARANELASAGFDAFDAGRFAEAHGHFAKAESAAHSPVFVLYMARCKRQLGDLQTARALYERVRGETLADDAPEPFRKARQDSIQELEQLDALVPVLSVTLEGLSATDRVSLDGEDVATTPGASSASFRREVKAGTHVLTITRNGVVIAEREFALKPGQTVDTSIVLPAPSAPAGPPPAPAAPAPTTSPSPTDAGATSSGPNLVPAYIVLGVAGAGAVLGAVMGGLALSQDKAAVDELESCDSDTACSAAEQTRDKALTFAHVSTTSFVVASVAAATGVVLILTAGDDDDVAMGVGPGSLELTVAF